MIFLPRKKFFLVKLFPWNFFLSFETHFLQLFEGFFFIPKTEERFLSSVHSAVFLLLQFPNTFSSFQWRVVSYSETSEPSKAMRFYILWKSLSFLTFHFKLQRTNFFFPPIIEGQNRRKILSLRKKIYHFNTKFFKKVERDAFESKRTKWNKKKIRNINWKTV